MLAQFRCGILPLRIETGRFVGEAVEMRLCKLCSNEEVEDEKHFLLKCPTYADIRSDTFRESVSNPDFIAMSEQEQFVHLIKMFPRRTAKFIVRAYLRRRSTLYY